MLQWLSRVYALMLWAYPPEFRREYGREMVVAFRNRAREVVEAKGTASLAPFMAHIISDWLGSAVRENNNMSMVRLRWIAAFPLAWLAAYIAWAATGYGITHPPDAYKPFQALWIWSSIGFFSMPVAFVAVGVWVVPSRKASAARIAALVVGIFGLFFIAAGGYNRAIDPAWWGSCILLGGAAAYFPSRRLGEHRYARS